ncbi:abnormal spindle-like microcephaly-associated protein homolog, partial [Stegodyphus dumicola]|uniref:abnormal spindle-like microcephaly-associated protein homolog n=1 Tax=Stegodyphus dumicola TaxID=202533 RepID=UPI0015B37500
MAQFYKKRKLSLTESSENKRSHCFTVQIAKSPEEKTEEKFLLELKPFSTFPHVTFDKVKLGSAKVCTLYVFNPLHVQQDVCIEKFPSDKGFTIDTLLFTIGTGEEKGLEIKWKPEKSACYREVITFKSSAGCKTRAYLHGTAYSPKKKTKNTSVKSKIQKSILLKSSQSSKCESNFQNLVTEASKENINFLNWGSENLGPDQSSIFKFVSTPKTREKFLLKDNDELPSSPIRRQTYTINQMLSTGGRESAIIPVPVHDSGTRKSMTGNVLQERTVSQNAKPKNILCHKVSNVAAQNMSGSWQCDFITKKYETSINNLQSIKNSFSENVKEKHVDLTETKCNLKQSSVNKSAKNSSECSTTPNIKNVPKKVYFLNVSPQLNNSIKMNIAPNSAILVRNAPKFPFKSAYEKENKRETFIKNDRVLKEHNDRVSQKEIQACNSESLNDNDDKKSENFLKSRNIVQMINQETNKIEIEKFATNPERTNFQSKSEFVNESFISIFESTLSDSKNVPVLLPSEMPSSFSAFDSTVQNSGTCYTFDATGTESVPEISYNASHFKDDLKRTIISQKKNFKSQFKSKPTNSQALKRENSKVSFKNKSLPHLKLLAKHSTFAPKRLNLTKPVVKKTIARNPFATLNTYYDEHWMEKQETAFTVWLNYILTPSDGTESSPDIKIDSAKIWIESLKNMCSVPAPSKEELSLKTYTAIKQLNKLRKSSCNLFQSEDIAKVVKKIEMEVDLKKISVRKDRAIHADLGIKKTILEMLLSYNPLWLRIGLETIYGEIITLQSNCDVIGLSRFIIHRFLSNPEIVEKYSHPSVINYYREGYEDELKRFVLKKFLILVFFLDAAKSSHLIEHNPCLFCKNSLYKSSRDFLLTFSREYLSGEGDITKHLRYLGYTVSHQQTTLDEFDYAVRNIAKDLRCGLRLGRVIEILLQDWSLSQSLRANTLNRTTKIHNNEVVLKALQNSSIEIEGNIEARDIVDGNREKTLSLLWQIIFKTQISKHINKEVLRRENDYLMNNLKLKVECAAFNALRNHTLSEVYDADFIDSKLYKENEVLQLLLQWCQNVCAHYDYKVCNFTSSFSDGQALCFLLHHYHPNILPFDSIKRKTVSSYYETQIENSDSEGNNPLQSDDKHSNSLLLEECLKNEKQNLELVFEKFVEIGQIPILSCPSDISNTLPDEKVIITLVSYVNIRLMELSTEIRAARRILFAWRKYRLRKQLKHFKTEIVAVIRIQRAWRSYSDKMRLKKLQHAAVVVQSVWRMHSARKMLAALKYEKYMKHLNQNATVIQALFRGYSARKLFIKCLEASIVIQKHVRSWLARSRFIKLKRTVLKIQSRFRAKCLGRAQRSRYLMIKNAVIKLQAHARGMLTRKYFDEKVAAIIVIQSFVRMWLVKKTYNKQKNACIYLQQKFRALLLAKHHKEKYLKLRKSAVVIQQWYRQIKMKESEIKAAIKIQASFRQLIQRKKFMHIRYSCITIQQWWRVTMFAKKARSSFLALRQHVVTLQTWTRRFITYNKFKKLKYSAIVIQKYFRMYSAKKEFKICKINAIAIQKWWRNVLLGHSIRTKYIMYKNASLKIQAVFRMYLTKKRFTNIKKTVCFIEHCILGKKERENYLKMKKSVIKLQSLFRAFKCRLEFKRKRMAAVKIQTAFRGYSKKKEFQSIRSSAVVIQQYYRSYKQMCEKRQKFLKIKMGIICFQSLYRGYKFRLEWNRKKIAIIIIQAAFRAYSKRNEFQKIKSSAVIIQKYYRSYRKMCHEQQKFLTIKRGFIKLQAVYRGRKCKLEWNRKIMAAVTIQAAFRAYSKKRKYHKIKTSAICIQQYYRCYKKMCDEQKKYLRLKTGITCLQAVYRGRKCRLEWNRKKMGAVAIQAAFRAYVAKRNFQRMKYSAMLIQQYYRSYKKMCEEHQKFLTLKTGIIHLQAVFRGHKCRLELKRKKMAAVKIQSTFKAYSKRKEFLKVRSSAILIQQYYRCYKNMCDERQNYLRLKIGIIHFQAVYRGRKCRFEWNRKKTAAITIQAAFRAYMEKRNFQKMKHSAILIQQYFRCYQKMQLERQKYLKMKVGFTRLQAFYHGVKVRQDISNLNKKAIVIQSQYRKWIAMKSYQKLREACCVIQIRYRAYQKMKKQLQTYQEMKRAAVIVQAFIRCKLSRIKYLKMRHASIKVQAFVRMVIAQQKYSNVRRAALIVQKLYRSKCLMIIQRNAYIKERNAVIFLQSKVRSVLARTKFLKIQKACILIQSTFRMWKQQKNYVKISCAVRVIQKRFRSFQIAQKERKNYLQVREACIKIQSFIRMVIQRNYFKRFYGVVVFVQKKYRSSREAKQIRENFLSVKYSCIKIQSFVRMYLEKRKFYKIRQACIVIQSSYRKHLAKKQYLRIKQATLTVQKHFVAWKASKTERNRYLKMRHSAVIIQSAFRSFIARKNFKKQLRACVVIQAHIRKYLCSKSYIKQKNAILVLQKHFRALIVAKQVRRSYLHTKKVIIVLQAAVRGWLIRKQMKVLHQSAMKIQAMYKCFLLQKRYNLKRKSAICIQRHFRSLLLGKKIRSDYLQLRSSATVIQSCWRGKQARVHYLKQRQAVILLQSHTRKMLSRRKSIKLKHSAILIQRFYRAYKTGSKECSLYQKKKESCLKIQAYWRSYKLHKKFQMKKEAAIIIQRNFRWWREKRMIQNSVAAASNTDFWVAYQQRMWFLNLKTNLIKFQQAARSYLSRKQISAILIQSYVKMWLARKKYMREISAIKIQALWRGYGVRQAATDKRILLLRERIKSADSDQRNSLRNRTTRALDILLGSSIKNIYPLRI